jgi:hypothetical protein
MDSKAYLNGWSWGARIVEAYSEYPKLCFSYARLIMRFKHNDEARGFFDAVMAGMGA